MTTSSSVSALATTVTVTAAQTIGTTTGAALTLPPGDPLLTFDDTATDGQPNSTSDQSHSEAVTVSPFFSQTLSDAGETDPNLIAAIVGGVLGCLLLLGVVIAIVVVAQRRKRDRAGAIDNAPRSTTEAAPLRSHTYGMAPTAPTAPLAPVYDANFQRARYQYDAVPALHAGYEQPSLASPKHTYEQPNETFM